MGSGGEALRNGIAKHVCVATPVHALPASAVYEATVLVVAAPEFRRATNAAMVRAEVPGRTAPLSSAGVAAVRGGVGRRILRDQIAPAATGRERQEQEWEGEAVHVGVSGNGHSCTREPPHALQRVPSRASTLYRGLRAGPRGNSSDSPARSVAPRRPAASPFTEWRVHFSRRGPLRPCASRDGIASGSHQSRTACRCTRARMGG
jgi:hypothetical protein